MSLFSKIFGGGSGDGDSGVRQPCLDSHRLFKVPVTISFDVVVAAPSEAEANRQEVLDAYLKSIMSDLQNRMDDVAGLAETARLGTPSLIRRVEEVPEGYESALPYENPKHPTGADVECRYWFKGV